MCSVERSTAANQKQRTYTGEITMAMRVVKIEANECTCERCGAVWIAKPVQQNGEWVTPVPVACTICKTAYWNRPKEKKNEKEAVSRTRMHKSRR